MIDTVAQQIQYKDKYYNILRWEVWFMTPVGLYDKYPDAQSRVRELDFDPRFTIVPVPVAIGDGDNIYEVFVRS